MTTTTQEFARGRLDGLKHAEKFMRDFAGQQFADFKDEMATMARVLASMLKHEREKVEAEVKKLPEPRCTCDDNGEGPCPVHAEEMAAQDKRIEEANKKITIASDCSAPKLECETGKVPPSKFCWRDVVRCQQPGMRLGDMERYAKDIGYRYFLHNDRVYEVGMSGQAGKIEDVL